MDKSAFTSINSGNLPKAYNLLDNKKVREYTGGIHVGTSIILDHGCGRYVEHISRKANMLGYGWYGYDKYWNTVEHVHSYDEALHEPVLRVEPITKLHISSNVMNVIVDDWELQNYCTGVYNLMDNGEYLLLTVYEAPKPSDTQRAEPLSLYVEKLESYYGLVTVRQTKGYAILVKH